jgi:hypothetical protein
VITGQGRAIAPGTKLEVLPGQSPAGTAPDAGEGERPQQAGDARGRAAGAAAAPR